MRRFEAVQGKLVTLPTRKTIGSAGYDFRCPYSYTLNAGETVVFKTGVKACMNRNEVLYIYIRSSLGIKHKLALTNGTGIIDSDYYNNPDNEGEILIPITNNGNTPYEFTIGDRIAQGIFFNLFYCRWGEYGRIAGKSWRSRKYRQMKMPLY